MATLKVKMTAKEYLDETVPELLWHLDFIADNYEFWDSVNDAFLPLNQRYKIKIGTPEDINATPYPIFPSADRALEALRNGASQGLCDTANALIGSTYLTDFVIFREDSAPILSHPTPTLNSGAVLSTTRDALVNYCVDISATLSLLAGQRGTVFLEYADDSGFTTNLKEVSRFSNGNTGALALGLNLTQTVTGTVSGLIPAGKYRRLRTNNDTGSPSFVARPSQEVLL